MKINEVAANSSDWCYLSQIDYSNPMVMAPMMVQELLNHTTTPLSAALQSLRRGYKRHCSRPDSHAFGSKSVFAPHHLNSAVLAMVTLVQQIAGIDVSEQINNRLSLMNNIGLSFAMLSSAKIARKLINWEFLPADATISGSSIQKAKLFCEPVIGFLLGTDGLKRQSVLYC